MLLGFQMISWVPGFGFCKDHGDFDLNYPAGALEPVVASLEVVMTRIDAVLLGQQIHNREVRYVIRSFISRGEDDAGSEEP